MSEEPTPAEQTMSKVEVEERLDKTAIELNTYQAAIMNKLLIGTPFRFDVFENSKRMVNSSNKKDKKKPSKTSKPPEFLAGMPGSFEETGHNTPGSFSSLQDPDEGGLSVDNSLGRRTSRRERKPATKPDLGYEEPKPIKGVKLSGASREIFRK